MDAVLIKVLREAKAIKQHNLGCYSKNWTLLAPKVGYEKEYEKARAEYHEVERLLEKYSLRDED